MKILLLGDYSNYHACLATALRRKGHKVVVTSDGSGWMNTERTLNFRRPLPGPVGGALLFMQLLASRRLSGYDIVSLMSPSFIKLRPSRLKVIFNRLKAHNGKVFLTSAGTDKAFMDMIVSNDCPLRYSEYFNIDGSPNPRNAQRLIDDCEWQKGEIGEFCEFIYENVDGVTTALYEYQLAMQRRIPESKLAYIGIPVDLDAVESLQRPLVHNGNVNIFLGRKREYLEFKGTDRLGEIARMVVDENPDKCCLNIVENLPYNEYLKALDVGDLVIDQLYSYTPATNALLAMAKGQAVVSGAEPEYYDFIGEKDLQPIFNPQPDDNEIYKLFTHLVNNPELIIRSGAEGREFIRRHNDADLVARRCLDFWTK